MNLQNLKKDVSFKVSYLFHIFCSRTGTVYEFIHTMKVVCVLLLVLPLIGFRLDNSVLLFFSSHFKYVDNM